MAHGFKHGGSGGGSGGLNFQVVGGATTPSNLKENTIWIDTDVKITSYIFSVTEPEAPADGKDGPVWICTSTESNMEFNALKKNGIQVYPISAKQYVSGAWVDVTAKSYQGGVWVDWFVWDGTLFPESPGIVQITGGWVNDPNIGSASRPNVDSSTVTEDAITIYVTGTSKSSSRATANHIDLTGYSHLKFNVSAMSGSFDGICMIYEDGDISHTDAPAYQLINAAGEYNLAVPSGGGKYRIGFTVSTSGTTRSFTVSEVRLVK